MCRKLGGGVWPACVRKNEPAAEKGHTIIVLFRPGGDSSDLWIQACIIRLLGDHIDAPSSFYTETTIDRTTRWPSSRRRRAAEHNATPLPPPTRPFSFCFSPPFSPSPSHSIRPTAKMRSLASLVSCVMMLIFGARYTMAGYLSLNMTSYVINVVFARDQHQLTRRSDRATQCGQSIVE